MTVALAGIVAASPRLEAQVVSTLINWDQPWRFNQSGSELGTAWRAESYPAEAQWEGPGQGLLGFEPDTGTYQAYEIINTPLAAPVSGGPITVYFRTTFTFSGDKVGLSVVATNLIDDGAVFYLNGTEVSRLRVTAPSTSTTLAGDHEASGGAVDVFTITNLSLIKAGVNTMAVEVHQAAATSSDVMFGMRLVAIRSTALSITDQPKTQTVVVGDPMILSVGVNGSPAAYRWIRNGVTVNGAVNATLAVNAASTNNEGNYFVIVTNILGGVTSQVATVTVVPDTVGPRALEAIGGTNARGAQTISITFSEPLNALLTTNNVNNFAIYAGTNYANRIPTTNISYAFTAKPTVTVFPSGAGWIPGTNYFVLINNAVDAKGNVSFPNQRVPVGWLIVSNLTQMSDAWEYNDLTDPLFSTVFDDVPAWYATNYSTLGKNWGSDQGIFYYAQDQTPIICAGDSLGRFIGFQFSPTLFRRSFSIPAGATSSGTLRLRYIVDDGMVLYLNGREVHLYNSRSGPVNPGSRASSATDGVCITNVEISVSSLLPGANFLAAAVVQEPDSGASRDTLFGFEMDYVTTRLSPLPAEPAPSLSGLTMTKVGTNLRLSWNTNFNGLALQYKTNLNSALPWITVSNVSNPFLTPIAGQTRLFRLYNWK